MHDWNEAKDAEWLLEAHSFHGAFCRAACRHVSNDRRVGI